MLKEQTHKTLSSTPFHLQKYPYNSHYFKKVFPQRNINTLKHESSLMEPCRSQGLRLSAFSL